MANNHTPGVWSLHTPGVWLWYSGFMPERKIPLVTDHYYHVFNKGVGGQNVFLDENDYQRMINVLWLYRYLSPPLRMSYLLRLGEKKIMKIKQSLKGEDRCIDVISYCLMPNHFHLLVKQVIDGGVSNFLHNLQNSYARYYNTRRTRFGPLFQGRFKAVLIKSEGQLVHVSRYIHLNPFSSSIVQDISKLKQYPWSSLQEYLTQTPSICDTKMLTNIFETSDKYWRFISDHADHQRKLAQIKHLTLE